MNFLKTVAACIAFAGVTVLAQTTVTTSGGTTNTVPLYTGGSNIGNSVITQSGGNVGIGTMNPDAKLNVNGNIEVDQGNLGVTSGTNTASGGFSSLYFGTVGGNTNNGYSAIQAFYAGVGYTTSLVLQNQGGHVGIGTTAPTGLLDVNGSGGTYGSGGFVVSGANLDPNAGYSLVSLENSAKLLEGWNYSAGAGEIDLISNRQAGVTGGFRFYDYSNSGVLTSLLTLLGNGNVGIGTTSPGTALEVNGNVKLTSGSGASITFADGTVQSSAYTGVSCGGDYAESVDVEGNKNVYGPGDVLVISGAGGSDVEKAREPYSTMVAGIYSTRPGYVGRRQTGPKSPDEVPMAMVGIVPTKVSAENGPVHRGDLLVSSSTAGYAMKGTDRSRMLGAVVGKAMGNLNSGKGVMEVLVTLQ